MEIYLYPLTNPARGPIRVKQHRFVIGRGTECDLHIPSPLISRFHAELFTEAESLYVRDLGSTNGTFVNATPITKCELFDGDVLAIAILEYEVRLVDKRRPAPPGHFCRRRFGSSHTIERPQ